MSRQRQFLSLQAGRGLAAAMVVVHHVGLFGSIGNVAAGKLGVEFFFVLSGMVILMAHLKDIGQPTRFSSFIWKRFRRIYPIYWVVFIPQVLWFASARSQGHSWERDPLVILSNFLLIHLHTMQVSLTVAWTLFHEVLFYGVFSILLLHRRIGIIIMALWLGGSIFYLGNTDPYGEFLFSALHLIFLLGMVAGWLLKRKRIALPWVLFVMGITVFSLSIFLENTLAAPENFNDLLAGFGAMLAMLGAAELERKGGLRVPRVFVFLGDASYSIYLIHYPVLYVTAAVSLHIATKLHLPLLLWGAIMTSFGIAMGCIGHMAIERPLLRWLSGLRVGLPAPSVQTEG